MSVQDWLPLIFKRLESIACWLPASAVPLGATDGEGSEILRGQVQMVRVDASGREVVLYSATAGELFAEAAVLPDLSATPSPGRAPPCAFTRRTRSLPSSPESPGRRGVHGDLGTRDHEPAHPDPQRAIFVPPAIEFAASSALNTGAHGRTVLLRGTLKDLAAELGLTHEACLPRRWPAWPPKERSSGSRARLCSEASPSACDRNHMTTPMRSVSLRQHLQEGQIA